jgi:beta propeller repeat protein
MNSVRNGASNILVFVLLVGLVVVVIALFNGQTSRSAAPNVSPVGTPTIVGVQASPLSIPTTVNVPVARLGEPVLVHASGRAMLLKGDPQKISLVSWEGDQMSATLRDLSTGQESTITATGLVDAHISGHWLAGVDQAPSGPPDYYSRIKVVDIDTGKERFLGDKSINQQRPSISGDIVVWEDRRNRDQSGTDIYAYDLKAGKEFPVVTTASVEIAPRISGQWITYLTLPTQYPPGEAPNTIELRAHSLKTGEDFSIGMIPSPNDASWGTHHAIDDDKVAWIKVTNATWGQYSSELHLYDLTSRTDRNLSDLLSDRIALDISLSAQSEMVVYNSPGGTWRAVDWRPSPPVVIPVKAPLKAWGKSLLVSGDYLVWKITLNREMTDVQLYAQQITRP